jgi:ribosomal protein S18 acetylase RimI-like enzyme
MSDVRMVPATELTMASLAELFTATYEGYEVPTHLDEATLRFLCTFVDVDLAQSVIAYDGHTPVAVCLLALRGERSWISGMGVVKEARGKGLGRVVMEAAIERAKRRGARVMHLEVLVNNAPARHTYEKLGFVQTRELVVWLRPADAGAVAAPDGLVPLDPGAALDAIDHWLPDPPPWQRAPESIANLPDKPSALGLMQNGALAGAVVYRAVPERISILALGARVPAAATYDALYRGMLAAHPGSMMRFLNLPAGDPAQPPLEALGAAVEARQVEMRLPLA